MDYLIGLALICCASALLWLGQPFWALLPAASAVLVLRRVYERIRGVRH